MMKADNELFAKPCKSILANYFTRGNSFSHHHADGEEAGTLILIHGWGVRAAAMNFIAGFLARHGFAVYNYDYPTSRYGIERHGEIFLEKFRALQTQMPDRGEISFLTHSMGALLLRTAWSRMTTAERCRISRIVMLAPPNQGSHWSDLARWLGLRRFNPALTDMGTGDSAFVNTIPAISNPPPIGIISGTRDLKVASKRVGLKNTPYQLLRLPYGHAGLRHARKAGEHALYFLRHGNFPACR